MACACKKSSGQVTSVKQVVKKTPSQTITQTTESKTQESKPIIKHIIYKRHI